MKWSLGCFCWVWFLIPVGCGDDYSSSSDPWDALVPSGPVACGDLTCSAGEICLETTPAIFLHRAPDFTYACAPAPGGCDPSRLCDCDVERYEGFAVHGCSNLNARTLYLVDDVCGERPCSEREACLVRNPLNGTEVTPVGCVALPNECSRNLDFCGGDTNCTALTLEPHGYESTGCFSSDFMVGVYIR